MITDVYIKKGAAVVLCLLKKMKTPLKVSRGLCSCYITKHLE